MFIRNRTPHTASLIRGHVSDTLDVATVVVESTFRAFEPLRLLPDPERPPSPSDPPTTSRYALWNEVSVTVSGTVYGPSRPPFMAPVSIQVGDELRRLVVFGERRWERSLGGALTPTDPERFKVMPLSFERAFGGTYDMLPGPHPVTGLPHPGGKVAYSRNPDGRGFYRDAAMAERSPLPNIELADQLIESWDDQPEPAGFAPCPLLIAIRFSEEFLARTTGLRPGSPPPDLTPARMAAFAPAIGMRALHHAPGRLIFSSVPQGTTIELLGVGRRPIRFEVPAAPAEVVTASGDKPSSKTGAPLRPELRSIHVDADSAHVLFAHGYTTTYRRDFGPEWLRVRTPRAG